MDIKRTTIDDEGRVEPTDAEYFAAFPPEDDVKGMLDYESWYFYQYVASSSD